MPLRSLNAYLSPSLLIVHDSARPGTTCVLSSGNVTSVSTTRRPTRLELRSVTCAGSRFTGSATRPTTSVPAGCAEAEAIGPTRPMSATTSASHTAAILIERLRSSDRYGDRGANLYGRARDSRGRGRHGAPRDL